MRRPFYFFVIIFFFATSVHAQMIENAGDYMSAMSNAQTEMDQKYMAYVSASAHSRRAKKLRNFAQPRWRALIIQSIKPLISRSIKGIIHLGRPVSIIFSFATAFSVKTIPRS